jgi:hypothetical protein
MELEKLIEEIKQTVVEIESVTLPPQNEVREHLASINKLIANLERMTTSRVPRTSS